VAKRSTDPQARYRNAWQAGNTGRNLSPGLAGLADADPLIDQAHDAGRQNASFDDFLSAHGLVPPTPAPSRPKPASSSSGGFGGKVASAGENLGLVLCGLLVGALVLSVFDYGPKGPYYWFCAKYLNDAEAQPSSGAKSTSTTAPTSTTATNAATG